MNKELEILKQIMNRLDKIEKKIDHLNDPYNLKNIKLNILPKTMPEGYTLVDTSGESDTSRTFGV